jgi:hypothetical protein
LESILGDDGKPMNMLGDLLAARLKPIAMAPDMATARQLSMQGATGGEHAIPLLSFYLFPLVSLPVCLFLATLHQSLLTLLPLCHSQSKL